MNFIIIIIIIMFKILMFFSIFFISIIASGELLRCHGNILPTYPKVKAVAKEKDKSTFFISSKKSSYIEFNINGKRKVYPWSGIHWKKNDFKGLRINSDNSNWFLISFKTKKDKKMVYCEKSF